MTTATQNILTIDEFKQLRETCIDESVTYAYLEERLATLKQLTQPELVEFHHAVAGFRMAKSTPKTQLVKHISYFILERKESFQRTQF